VKVRAHSNLQLLEKWISVVFSPNRSSRCLFNSFLFLQLCGFRRRRFQV
jgi:hypothetical protein